MNESYCKRGARQPFKDYLKEMAQSKFAFSPRGLASDCYRNWEALLVGTIPIIRSSEIDPLFEDLPVLIVNSWDEVTQEFLERKYVQITSRKYDIKRLYMDYWLAKIEAVRQEFLRG